MTRRSHRENADNARHLTTGCSGPERNKVPTSNCCSRPAEPGRYTAKLVARRVVSFHDR